MSRPPWGLLLSVLLLPACAPAASTAGAALTLGVIVPPAEGTRGAAAFLEGAELAAGQINADGGVRGRPLVLLRLEERAIESAPQLVAALAARGAVAVLGPLGDASAVAAAPAAERHRLVLITPGAAVPLPYGGHYVFRTALPAHSQAQAVAAHLVDRLGARRIAVVHDSNAYGTMVALAFEQAVRARGAVVTGCRLFRQGERDFTRHLRGALAEGAQAIFLAAYPPEGALFLRQARAAAPGLPVGAGGALYTEDTSTWAGTVANDLYVPAGFLPDVPLPLVRSFVAAYRERYGRTPEQIAAQAYDAVRVLAFALRRAGADRERMRNAVATLRRFPAVTGNLTFDRFGDPLGAVVVARLSGGRFVAVRQ
ncbi:MAG: ABC transporter substrate-binding protein [Armatimonadota bacterium]|nr:ABC transporter substrate-binding protein [Armatimonadota bacterium]MDR7427639.1 ABC transporter substrate-binding protein [Armatimonadota bacterium]MDR7464304.1 ABC transporter substrate-binding protein [Armatimonadota bacterium]MDR7473586.1 ABC transporter substrate-binding protein [Armatimonadota bacterium]MDR7538893.1 ABC transporter substrate-binding protein [Armatimonadota bacterium]